MKTRLIFVFCIALFISGCDEAPEDEKYVHKIDWSNNLPKSQKFQSYKSVFTYSPIYLSTQKFIAKLMRTPRV